MTLNDEHRRYLINMREIDISNTNIIFSKNGKKLKINLTYNYELLL